MCRPQFKNLQTDTFLFYRIVDAHNKSPAKIKSLIKSVPSALSLLFSATIKAAASHGSESRATLSLPSKCRTKNSCILR